MVTMVRETTLCYTVPRLGVNLMARLYQPWKRWILFHKPTPLSHHACSEQLNGAWSLVCSWQRSCPHRAFIRCTCASSSSWKIACAPDYSCEKWMATDRPTSIWGPPCLSHGRHSKGPPSAPGAGTTACCPGSRDTSATAGLKTAPARNASSSSSASGSWPHRWRSAGSRPTRVWRASSRSRWELCPASPCPEPARGTRGHRHGQTR